MPLLPPPPSEDDAVAGAANREALIKQAFFHIQNAPLTAAQKAEVWKGVFDQNVDQRKFDDLLDHHGVDNTHRRLLRDLKMNGATAGKAQQAMPEVVNQAAEVLSSPAQTLQKTFSQPQVFRDANQPPPTIAPPPAPSIFPSGMSRPKGMVEPGNTEIYNRPVLQNTDPNDPFNEPGSISTTSSSSFQDEDGSEVLIPTVVNGKRLSKVEIGPDGKPHLNMDAAIDHYRQTGEHLGKFDTPENADAYAWDLHFGQVREGQSRGILPPPAPAAEASTLDVLKGLPRAAIENRNEANADPRQNLVNTYGTLAKMGAGYVKGASLSYYDPSAGTFQVPGTGDIFQLRDKTLPQILEEQHGMDPALASDGSAAEIGQFFGSIMPWSAISRGLSYMVGTARTALAVNAAKKATEAAGTATTAISPELAERIVPIRKVVDIAEDILKRAGIQAATGATFAAVEAAPPNETGKDKIKRMGETALWAAGLSAVVDGLLSIPEATQSARFGALSKVKTALTDLMYRSGKATSPEAASEAADTIIDNVIRKNGGIPKMGWSKQIADDIASRADEIEATKQKAADEAASAGRGKVEPAAGSGGIEQPSAPEGPAPGTVRFYHGGVPGEEGTRWVTPDYKYAAGYASKSPGATVSYVDIPEDSPLLKKSFDDTGSDVKAPYVPFEVPAGQLRPVSQAERDQAAPLPQGAPVPGEPPAAGVVQGGKTVETIPMAGKTIKDGKIVDQVAPNPEEFSLTSPPAPTVSPFDEKLKTYMDQIRPRYSPEEMRFLQGALSQIEESAPKFEKGFGPFEAVEKYEPATRLDEDKQSMMRGHAVTLWDGIKTELGQEPDAADHPETAKEYLDGLLGREAPAAPDQSYDDIIKDLVDAHGDFQAASASGANKDALDRMRVNIRQLENKAGELTTRPDRSHLPTLERNLHSALYGMSGAPVRWDVRRQTGLTDSELKEAIAYELGHEGSSYGGDVNQAHKGGKEPAFWSGDPTGSPVWSHGKPTLKGQALVDKVRDLMKIPDPGAATPPKATTMTPPPSGGEVDQQVGGASDTEVQEVGDELKAAEGRQDNGSGSQVTHVFDPPAPSAIVRLQNKAKASGFMTPAEAKQRIEEWKAHALKQGETHENGNKIVLSLFDKTGQWSQPWEDAGYQVYRFDIQTDPENGDVRKFSSEFFNDLYGAFEGQDIYAVLAACPCTDFAVSGARHFAAKDADGRTLSSVELVQQTLATIEYFKPSVWGLENPVGRIEKLTGLPPWRLSFDPSHFGDPYTKKTLIWGRFNADLPIAPVEPVEGSKMHTQYGGSSMATKNARSVTPEGFAYSFFMANNAIDHPVMAIANKWDRLDNGLIEKAVKAGLTEEEIDTAVEDAYYMDLDDKKAETDLRAAITAKTGKGSGIAPPPGPKSEPAKLLEAAVNDQQQRWDRMNSIEETIERNAATSAGAGSKGGAADSSVKKNKKLREQLKKLKDEYKQAHEEIKEALGQQTADAVKEQVEGIPEEDKTVPVTDLGKAHQAGKMGPPPGPHDTEAQQAQLDADIEQVDAKFKPLIADPDKRRALVRQLLWADIPIISGQKPEVSKGKFWGIGGVVDGITKYISENVTKDGADFNISSSHKGDGVQLKMRVWDGKPPSQATIDEAQRWLDHLYPDDTPKMPTIKSALDHEERPALSAKPDLKEVAKKAVSQKPAAADIEAIKKRLAERQESASAGIRGPSGHARMENRPRQESTIPTGNVSDTKSEPSLTDLDDQTQSDLVTLGGYLFSENPDYTAWREQMLASAGDWAAPYLQSTFSLIEEATAEEGTAPSPTAPGDSTPSANGPESIRPPPGGTDVNANAAAGPGAGPAAGNPQVQSPSDVGGTESTIGPPPGEVQAAGGSPAGGRGTRAPRSRPGTGTRSQSPANRGPGSGRAQPPGEIAAGVKPTPPPHTGPLNTRNYRITEVDRLGDGGPATKFRNNIAAIRLVRDLQKGGRLPTFDEKRTLARYVGWGSLSQSAFDVYNREFRDLQTELKALLTPEEYDAARASTKNAHYTSEEVVNFMWKVAERMGFKGGTVLEPAMGTGNFFGLMPRNLAEASNLTGVELDPTTGAIASYLYPDARVFARGYETVTFPDNSIDFAVGNVPFGDYKLHDPRYNKLKLNIHDYFFVKTLDKVRPGAVIMFVTSKGTLDKKSEKVRRLLADQADLVAAFRLPDTAFKRNAGTDVTTDIIILRKRLPGEVRSAESFATTGKTSTNIDINEYYLRHPENMFGKMTLEGTMYGGNEPTLEETGPVEPMMVSALGRVPRDVFGQPGSTTTATIDSLANIAPDHVKENAFTIENGKVLQRKNGVLVRPENEKLRTGEPAERIRSLVGIRDQLKRVIEVQLKDESDDILRIEQQELGKLYDSYVQKNGILHNAKVSSVFQDDPEYPLVLSIETYDQESRVARKADIFTTRTIAPMRPLTSLSTDPKEALLQVVGEKGFPDLDRMAEISNESTTDLRDRLEALDLIYEDPNTGRFEMKDQYLSGNVVDKLDAAQIGLQTDPRFNRNVEALKAVQPTPVPIHEIRAELGAPWIGKNIINDFIYTIGRTNVDISYAGGVWIVKGSSSSATDAELATRRVGFVELVELALNQKRPTVYDTDPDGHKYVNQVATVEAREKQELLKQRFQDWIPKSEYAPTLQEAYNRAFNNIRLFEADGSHLTLPGKRIGAGYDFRPYQSNVVWRGIVEGRMLIGHEVGLGKTFEMIAIGMELRRLGMSKKNMFVAYNGRVEQFRQMFQDLYPAARILVIGSEDLQGKRRKETLSRVATNDWDAVILQQSTFGLIPISPEWVARYIQKEMDELVETLSGLKSESDRSQAKKRSIKQLEKAKSRLEAKLKDLLAAPKDDTIFFDHLGVDMLFVDEFHSYKNLPFYTKIGRISGLSGSTSQRATDMKTKTDFMLETHNNRGVIAATGTPITNSMAEIYNMTRYIAPDLLERAGIRYFDEWKANFGRIIDVHELAPDGRSYKSRQKFAKFINAPEMLRMFRAFADIKRYEEMAGTGALGTLQRPSVMGGAPRPVAVEANEYIEPLFADFVLRGEQLHQGHPRTIDGKEDNWLWITSDAKKVSLDARLYDPTMPDHPDSKSNRAVEIIADRWEATRPQRSTILIFSDNFAHHVGDRTDFNLFSDMKRKLIAHGIPENEIAVVHDWADKPTKMEVLQKRMNTGEIRILFGTREKLGVGINIQKKLKVEIDLDAPWRPDQLEQGHGRIVRQGNENQDVELIQMITERSFDAYIFQALETKARFIQQAMTSDITEREIDDLASAVVMNYATQKAIASGNPDVQLKVNLESEIGRLRMLERAFHESQRDRVFSMERLRHNIAYKESRIEAIDKDYQSYVAADGENTFSAVIGGEHFAERKDAIESMKDRMNEIWRNGAVLTLKGVPVRLNLELASEGPLYSYTIANERHMVGGESSLYSRRSAWRDRRNAAAMAGKEKEFKEHQPTTEIVPPAEAFLQSADVKIRQLKAELDDVRRRLESDIQDLERFHQLEGETFRDTDKLKQKQQELATVTARLSAVGLQVNDRPDDEVTDPNAPDDEDDQEGDIESGGEKPGPVGPPSAEDVVDAEEEARKRVSEAIGEVPAPGGSSIRRVGPPPAAGQTRPRFESAFPEVQDRVAAARNLNTPSDRLIDRIRGALDHTWKMVTRKYPELPNGARFGWVTDKLTHLEAQRGVVRDRVGWLLQDYVLGLTPEQEDNLGWKIMLDDFKETFIDQMNSPEEQELPFGYTRSKIETDLARLNEFLDAQDPAVVEATKRRLRAWAQLREKYIDAMERYGWNSAEKKLTKEYYMPHRVIEYAQLKTWDESAPARAASDPRKRSFLRQRKAHNKDLNMNYLEADFVVMARMMLDTVFANTLADINDREGIQGQLKAQAFSTNEQAAIDVLAEMAGGDPEEGERAYRKLGQRQAEALDRLGTLAIQGELPDNNGRFVDAVDILAENYQRNLQIVEELGDEFDTSDREMLSREQFGRVMSYASWLAGEQMDQAIPAKMLFKGMAEKRKTVQGLLGEGGYVNWEDLIPEGYDTFPSRPDRTFFTTYSLSDQVAMEVFENAMTEEMFINPKELHRVMALGGKQRVMVLPKEIVKTLNNLQPPLPGPVQRLARSFIGSWKHMMTHFPTRWLGYNFRNMTEYDKAWTFNPGSLTRVVSSARELWPTIKGKKPPMGDLMDWWERGGMQSILRIQEVGDINRLKEILDLAPTGTWINSQNEIVSADIPARILYQLRKGWRAYWNTVDDLTAWREAILRYANYKEYLEQMRRNPDGRPDNFGGSREDEVMAHTDIKDRAFKLSNELLGAFNKVTAAGQFLRGSVMPFWSFPERNAVTWIRGFLNEARLGKVGQAAGRRLVSGVMRMPYTAWRVFRFWGMALMAAAIPLFIWNNLFHPDEEEDIPDYDRYKPHFIYGRSADGRPKYIGNLGTLFDVTEWFGLEESPFYYRMFMDGLMTWPQILEAMAMKPIEKFANLAGPWVKAFPELLAGRSAFPDPFNPRRVDRMTQFFSYFGLSSIYKSLEGEGDQTAVSFFFKAGGKPGEADYDLIRNMKYMEMKRLGKGSVGDFGETEKSEALRHYRLSLRDQDAVSADRNLTLYFTLGGTPRGMMQSLRKLDPLDGLNAVERGDFIARLAQDDQVRLVRAVLFFENMTGLESEIPR